MCGAAAASETRGQDRLRKGLAGSGEVPRAVPQEDTQNGGLSLTGPLWGMPQRDRQEAKMTLVHNLTI